MKTRHPKSCVTLSISLDERDRRDSCASKRQRELAAPIHEATERYTATEKVYALARACAEFLSASMVNPISFIGLVYNNLNEDGGSAEYIRGSVEIARLRAALLYAAHRRGSSFDYETWVRLCTEAGLSFKNGVPLDAE